jgi:hypothetical protein
MLLPSLMSFIFSPSLNPHLVHRQHGRIMALPKFWIATVPLAPYLVPGQCDIVAMNWRHSGLDVIADGVDKYFCPVREHRYLLCAILV